MFVRDGKTWSQVAYLKKARNGDLFGGSVSVSGDTMVIGAKFEDSSATGINGDETDSKKPDAGATYVFDSLKVNSLSITTTNGSVNGIGDYLPGETATLTATPDPGFLFDGWNGDASGTDNPLDLVMDSNKTVGATMVRDTSDADGDGLSAYEEIVTYGTDPDQADTDGDGFYDGFEVINATDLKSPFSSPPMGLTFSVSKANGFLFGVFLITPPIGGIIAIEESRNLRTWSQIDSFVGDGQPFTRTVLPSGEAVYYRLRLIDQSQ